MAILGPKLAMACPSLERSILMNTNGILAGLAPPGKSRKWQRARGFLKWRKILLYVEKYLRRRCGGLWLRYAQDPAQGVRAFNVRTELDLCLYFQFVDQFCLEGFGVGQGEDGGVGGVVNPLDAAEGAFGASVL